MDHKAKFLFLAFNKTLNMLDFLENSKIFEGDNQLLLSSVGYINSTEKIMMMGEINHKIGVVKSLKNIKYFRCKSRKEQESF